ncbi:MAG: hypothetical protein J6T72_00445 [Alphaproteobacteria bacterium]|nr:hypothetical protein [Alphaproteobacteria bacterium]
MDKEYVKDKICSIIRAIDDISMRQINDKETICEIFGGSNLDDNSFITALKITELSVAIEHELGIYLKEEPEEIACMKLSDFINYVTIAA